MSTSSPAVASVSIDQLLAHLNQGLADALPHHEPALLYEPLHYTMAAGGKRIRPLLTLLTYQAFSGKNPTEAAAIRLALGVELLHSFTLIHDDIMDNAPTRRGQATVQAKWGRDVAILSGDAMFARAMSCVVTSFPERASELGHHFAEAARIVCEGQAEDMAYTGQANVTVAQYTEMIRKKTAALLGYAMAMGASAAGAESSVVERVYRFGELVGLGFQLMDDLLDVYADPDKLGKQVGGDILEGKNTYLWLRALEQASPQERKELVYWSALRDRDQEKIRHIKALYSQLGIEADTRALIQDYHRRAEAEASSLLEVPGFQTVVAYLDSLLSRVQ